MAFARDAGRRALAFARQSFGRALISVLVLALLASVLLPALETRRIMQLLREITEVIEPARTLSWELESGLAMEYSALQGYALSGDSAFLDRYRMIVEEESSRIQSLKRIAERLDPAVGERAAIVGRRIYTWQALNTELLDANPSRERFATQVRTQRILRDSIIADIDRLPIELSAVAERMRTQVRQHEQRSLLVNATLVVIALGAMIAVVVATRRERRIARILQRRVDEEAALRRAAEALAGAFTIDDVAQQLAQSALDATQAPAVWVEHVGAAEDGSLAVTVRGAAGDARPRLGATGPYAGSYTAQVVDIGRPTRLLDLDDTGPSIFRPAPGDAYDETIVVPLGRPPAPRGALFIANPPADRALLADTGWTHTFAHLAALAYEKVRLLDEAREGRMQLERLMKSRQRLMRGFSHDVKNPLGAADGYAELLTEGIYGQLAPTQAGTVGRIRRSIQHALGLIDDLHELARAETGNISLRREALDVGELVCNSGEEYRGAANASGLTLNVDIADELPTIVTDPARLRQVLGNLLSNAIKYTSVGSVTLRVHREVPTALADAGSGDWVRFDVTDTGFGVPNDKRDLIFEEFSRLGGTDRPGAGLGLAISRRIAELLGGDISLESELGVGSTFTLRIPSCAPKL